MSEQIRRVAVWSGRLRLLHGLLALTTLTLMASGWLIGNAPMLADAAVDIHYLAAGVLLAVLAVRIALGIAGRATERFEQLLPRRSELRAIRASLLFYLSLGRAPLPNWYAHNPLWKPLYLFLYLMLTLLLISGWLMPENPVLGRMYLPDVHTRLADTVWVLVIAHLFSVMLQDIKGRAADISAMLSGHRFFMVDKTATTQSQAKPVSIKLDDFGKS